MASRQGSAMDWSPVSRRRGWPIIFWSTISKGQTMRWRWWCAILELSMNSQVPEISRQYAAALRRYLVRQRETLLQRAYELGRKAIAAGLGVLDVARVHQQALGSCLLPAMPAGEREHSLMA